MEMKKDFKLQILWEYKIVPFIGHYVSRAEGSRVPSTRMLDFQVASKYSL